MAISLDTRFWKKVQIPTQDGACWLWQASCNGDGHGHIWLNGKMVRATHVAWFLTHGVWPSDLGLQCLHHCDSPRCVNVVETEKHVFLGTDHENKIDASRKGRLGGETHHSTSLTEADVIEIRRLAAVGTVQQQIADLFGISRQSVSEIARGVSWKHVQSHRRTG